MLYLDVDVRNIDKMTPPCLKNREHRMRQCINGEFVCTNCLMEVSITKVFFFDHLEIISQPWPGGSIATKARKGIFSLFSGNEIFIYGTSSQER